MCVCKFAVYPLGSGVGDSSSKEWDFLGTRKIDQTTETWKYYRIGYVSDSEKEAFKNNELTSLEGLPDPLESGELLELPHVSTPKYEYYKNWISWTNGWNTRTVTAKNCGCKGEMVDCVEETYEKLDNSTNELDHYGDCKILNCIEGSAYCVDRNTNFCINIYNDCRANKLAQDLWDSCKGVLSEDGQISEWRDINWCKIGDSWYRWQKNPPQVGMAFYEEGVPIKYNGTQNFTLSGNGSAEACFEKAKAEKATLAFYDSQCFANLAKPHGATIYSQGDENLSGTIPAEVFTKICKMDTIDLSDNKPSVTWSLNTIYGTQGLKGATWSCPKEGCGGLADVGLSADGEWKIDDKAWGATGQYKITPRLQISFDSHFGKQIIPIDVAACDVKVMVDCAKFVKGKGCESEQNQEKCKKLCQEGNPFCLYIGRNRCIDKNTEGATAIDKVNYFSEKNYPVPDGYTGPLPGCAFSGLCRETNDLVVLFVKIADFFFGIIGSVSFLFFIAGGFMMIISLGNSDRVASGRKMIVAAITGMVISFSAYLLVNFFLTMMGVDAAFRALK
ncbi:MAG TPA: pilin [Candidatus Magasanikbacteria bacterium]|nr:pilin [Candidatus Magasanikbacteria bacterium]